MEEAASAIVRRTLTAVSDVDETGGWYEVVEVREIHAPADDFPELAAVPSVELRARLARVAGDERRHDDC